MNTWSLTITCRADVNVYTGQSPTPYSARAAAITTAHAWARRATLDMRYRYTIHVDGHTAAIIDTGVDDHGQPAHQEAARLLRDLYTAPVPPVPSVLAGCRAL